MEKENTNLENSEDDFDPKRVIELFNILPVKCRTVPLNNISNQLDAHLSNYLYMTRLTVACQYIIKAYANFRGFKYEPSDSFEIIITKFRLQYCLA